MPNFQASISDNMLQVLVFMYSRSQRSEYVSVLSNWKKESDATLTSKGGRLKGIGKKSEIGWGRMRSRKREREEACQKRDKGQLKRAEWSIATSELSGSTSTTRPSPRHTPRNIHVCLVTSNSDSSHSILSLTIQVFLATFKFPFLQSSHMSFPFFYNRLILVSFIPVVSLVHTYTPSLPSSNVT